MKMSDLISPADVMIDVRLASKSLLLKALAAKAAITPSCGPGKVAGRGSRRCVNQPPKWVEPSRRSR